MNSKDSFIFKIDPHLKEVIFTIAKQIEKDAHQKMVEDITLSPTYTKMIKDLEELFKDQGLYKIERIKKGN